MLSVVILAGGQGKRMKSDLPKMLHLMSGQPLLEHVINAACDVNPDSIYVVYGHEGEQVANRLTHLDVTWVEQKQQLGTGHAAQQVLSLLDPSHHVLFLLGDTPLIPATLLRQLISTTPKEAIGLITCFVSNPEGLGRIIRDSDGQVIAVVEHKDASPEQRASNEINTGIFYLPVVYAEKWLPMLTNNNAQAEYYLPDILAMAVKEGVSIHTVQAQHEHEVAGVNTRLQLIQCEQFYSRQCAEILLDQGVYIRDPARFDCRGSLTVGVDTNIDVNTIFEGTVTIGKRCSIGPNVILKNVVLGDDVIIKANSMIEDSSVRDGCIIGPFARIRPGSTLNKACRVGNFVEIKASNIGEASKINHLSYVGDAVIGKRVNIGAGTITCNYDGANKHTTTIEDNVFIGSNCSIVAPINIGQDATVGAGSTITKNVPAQQLTLCRAQTQVNKKDWKRPTKRDKEITCVE